MDISVINQLNAQILFYNKFIICLYMFRALLCLSSGGQNCIIQHLVSSHSVGGRPVQRLRGVLSQTCAPDGHLQVWWYQMLNNTILTSWWWAQQCSKHVEACNKLIIKKNLCIKLVNYWDYTEMHGQQNIKIKCIYCVVQIRLIVFVLLHESNTKIQGEAKYPPYFQ